MVDELAEVTHVGDIAVPTPMIAKQARLEAERDILREFLTWLDKKDWVICRWEHRDEDHYEISESPEQLIALFYEIDLTQVSAERKAILEAVRRYHEEHPHAATTATTASADPDDPAESLPSCLP